MSTAFEAFWNSFPPARQLGRATALKEWEKVSADANTVALIFKALGAQALRPVWTRNDGQFVPRPARWLRERRWLDNAQPASSSSSDSSSRAAPRALYAATTCAAIQSCSGTPACCPSRAASSGAAS